MMRRRIAFAVVALAGLALLSGPTGRIAIQTHDLADPSPHRVELALGMGKAVLSLLVTWSSHR